MILLREGGFAIFEDFSIVGFDSIPGADIFHPALTTVELGYAAGAEMAVEMILQRKLSETYILPQKLIIRESTRGGRMKNLRHDKIDHAYGITLMEILYFGAGY